MQISLRDASRSYFARFERQTALVHAPIRYRSDIDGVRALAVLSVVVFHAFPTALSGGFIGVDVFFVISGFLITSIVAGDVDARAFSYKAFYARRIKRIFPALLVVLSVALGFGWVVQVNDEFSSLGRHVIGSAAFFENFMLMKEPSYFDSKSDINPLLHLWSLGVEEQFYIVWPIIIGLVWRLRRSLAFVIILAIALVSLAISETWVFQHPMAAFYSPFSRFWELLAGGFVALFSTGNRDFVTSAAARNTGAAIGLAAIVVGLVVIDQQRRFPGLWAALPVLGTSLLIWSGGTSWINRTILSHPAAVGLGLISYPLYLWHWVLLAYGRLVCPRELTTPELLTIVGLSILLAWATREWVEKPFKGLRMRWVAVLCIGMVAIAGVGYAADHALEPRLAHAALKENEFVRSRESDGSCATLLGLPTTAEEVCQTKSDRPDVLIAGDSHAMALNAAALIGQSAMNTLMIAGHSCHLFTSVVQTPETRQSWGNNCTAIAWDVVAAARLKSIKTILITARGPIWSDENARASIGFGLPRALNTYAFRDTAGHVLSTEKAELKGYRDLISTLLATGKKLVFVVDVPGLKIDPHTCVARIPFVQVASCDISISEVADHQRGYRSLVDILATEFPTLTIFDATKVLCTDVSCPAGDASGYFYFDTNHLSAHGSELVLAALAARLNARSDMPR